MIIEVDGSFYETYPRERCTGCSFKAEKCTLRYNEMECIDETGKPAIWKPITRETVQRILTSRIR